MDNTVGRKGERDDRRTRNIDMTPHEFIDFFLMRVGEMFKRKLFIRIINQCLDNVNNP